MFYAHRPVVTLSRTGERGDNRVQAGGQEQKEGGDCHQAPLSSCQAAAEQPYPAVRPSQAGISSFHRSALLMSLFSRMVNCSMMNPFGLSSERPVFWSEQEDITADGGFIVFQDIVYRRIGIRKYLDFASEAAEPGTTAGGEPFPPE